MASIKRSQQPEDQLSQVTRTKILIPRRRNDLISRKRLLDALYELLNHHLVTISAPAGSGKTSLLIDLAADTALPVCWYSIDSFDRNPQRFLRHFIAAIAQQFPGFSRQSNLILQQPSGVLNWDQSVTNIVNEIYEQIHEYFIIVLDDYHLVDDCEEITDFIDHFARRVSDNCHLIIASRSRVKLKHHSLLQARREIGTLPAAALAFRLDEVQTFALRNYQLELSNAEAAKLLHKTAGWITGLLLSTQSSWSETIDRIRPLQTAGVNVYDYLTQQVLDQVPPTLRYFLLVTALFDEFDKHLCQAVLGDIEDWLADQSIPATEQTRYRSWQDLMAAVLNEHLFVLQVGDGGTWLRYHQLFQKFLRNRIAAENPGQRQQILYRLAHAYQAQGNWDQTHETYQRLGDLNAITELIETIGPRMLGKGEYLKLGRWLDQIPAEQSTGRSRLLYLKGAVEVARGNVEAGLTTLDQAESLARANSQHSDLKPILIERAAAHRFLAHYRQSIANADRTLQLTDDQNTTDQKFRVEALRAKGIGLLHLGYLREANTHLEQALALCRSLPQEKDLQAVIVMELGLAHMESGRFNRANSCYEQVLDYHRQTGNLHEQAIIYNNLGVLRHLMGNYIEAVAFLEQALTNARQTGQLRIEALALTGIGDVYVDLGIPQAARDIYEKAYRPAQQAQDHLSLLFINIGQVSTALMNDDLGTAQYFLHKIKTLANKSGSEFEQGLYNLTLGRFQLAAGYYREAELDLQKAASFFSAGGQLLLQIRTYLYLALAAVQAENPKQVAHWLQEAFERMLQVEHQQPCSVTGREARAALLLAQEIPTLTHQAERCLKLLDEFEESLPTLRRQLRRQLSSVPFAPPQLAIRSLGQTLVSLNGQPVTHKAWRYQRRAREFFFFLLTSPNGLAKDTAITHFWPESSRTQLNQTLKNTVYRLRQALGKEIIKFDHHQERYRFNRNVDYQYDVETFNRLLTLAEKTADPNIRIHHYRKAISLYQGPFLPEVDEIWVWEERERLQRLFIKGALTLISLLMMKKQYEEALRYCHCALAQDRCLEEFHRQAMQAYAALGNRAGLVRQYQACRTALLAEVDAPPSAKTETLYRSLLSA